MHNFSITGEAQASDDAIASLLGEIKEIANKRGVKLTLHPSKRLWLSDADIDVDPAPLANDELTDGPMPE